MGADCAPSWTWNARIENCVHLTQPVPFSGLKNLCPGGDMRSVFIGSVEKDQEVKDFLQANGSTDAIFLYIEYSSAPRTRHGAPIFDWPGANIEFNSSAYHNLSATTDYAGAGASSCVIKNITTGEWNFIADCTGKTFPTLCELGRRE
ncbi:hypothetical protein ElyMa_002697000 [Elysia marginata]|uniref:C-type lectin domain-containing protein n=1 Tax=Elysia marginata TaxID=1093978 RepID=A0AAV4HCX4_9GAST|nr:hypothetical protein ElyMa_002697000 [Elysia marginata]